MPRRRWSPARSTSAPPRSRPSTSSAAGRHAPLGLSQSRPQGRAAAGGRRSRHRKAAQRGVRRGDLWLGAGRGRSRLFRGYWAAGCTVSTPRRARSAGKSIAGRRRFPGAHVNNLFMASPILADGKVVFGGGTLEQLFAGTKEYPGSTGRGFLVGARSEDRQDHLEVRRRPEAGKARSAGRRGKTPGASTSSSTAPRRAASGPRRRTIPKPTRCSSAPT